jgi:chondroitin-sulfate-ABC endolyase/exolyase
LGSDISGGDGQHAVETTIFQNCISSMKEVPSNWKGISAQQRHREDAQLYADPAGHAYIVPKGQDLQFHDGLQHSVNHNGKKKTEGQFATLWLNHGLRPQQGSYEFCVIVNGASRMDELRESEALPYALIAHDERQHALHFPKQDLKMFSFFEAQDIDDELLLGVNGSCLVAYQKHDNGTFSLSAVDPDMNRLDKDEIREKSKGLFKFLNQEQNQYLPDRPVRFQIKIRAGFQLVGNPPQIKVLESSPTGTLLEVTTLGGVAQTLQLKKH